MKRLLIFGLLMISSAAGGIEKGASRDAVLAELGEPSGSMRNGSKEILLFKTGTVTLQGGIVITADISKDYARQAEERALKAKEIMAEKQAEQEKQKRLYPEDHVIQIGCTYSKAENWEMLPESIRPLQGVHGYDIYIPQGYHESDNRFYPCLFLESPAFWDGVKERVRKEKWIVVILREPIQPPVGKTLNGNFLAAYDDATVRFRIAKDVRFIAGRMPSAIFAAMRPAAGIILQEPDFSGLQKNGIALDFLRRNRDLRAYVLLSNGDRDNVAYQAQFVIERIPKYHIEVYQNEPVTLPPSLSDSALDWMKKEYALP